MLQFQKYLESIGLSPKSLKNYRSDISHFISWAILKLKSFGSYVDSLEEITPFIDSPFASEYKSYMVENSIPVRSVNRRLSTLRHLSKFLVSSQIIDKDFMNGIENISLVKKTSPNYHSIIQDFQSYLKTQSVSKNTIKNYLSDTRQFLTWLEKNYAHST